MRTNFKFALMSAAALLSLGLASCSSNDEAAPENLTSDGKAVKTQFSIDFAGSVMKTRMTAETVQNAQTVRSFRGMDNIVLIPFSAQGNAGDDPVAADALPLGKQIALTNMLEPNTATVANSIPASTSTTDWLTTTKGNAVLYNDVEIPLSTGSFLFYGKAIDTGTEKFVNGALTATIDDTKTPSNYGFAPVNIYASGTSTIGTALADYLTAIAKATTGDTDTPANKKWAEVTATENEGLLDLYTNFTSLKAGSSRDVQAAVEDLHQSLYKNTDAISKAICAEILKKATKTTVDPYDGTLDFDPSLGEVATTISATSENKTYPGDLNIPDGAALLSWDATAKKFEQKLDGTTANIGTNITGKFTDYVYPASLYYVANSGVVTAKTSQQASYDGSKEWAGAGSILEGYTEGKSVKASSKSVAIVDQIQYAVGRLDTKVYAENGTLYDRKGDAVVGTDADRFPITGVLIGGQKPVDYMFHPATGTPFTIYDNILKANTTIPYATATEPTAPQNYTLALETPANEAIYVAVEFLNNSGQDFQGFDGVVPAGGKFYLVAQLKPSEGTGYDATNLNQVFKQDYKTIATFKIGQGTADTNNDGESDTPAGLANAYNTIPDLRTPKLELGLSVNLEWRAGLQYVITF